jgi:hypothetical protein
MGPGNQYRSPWSDETTMDAEQAKQSPSGNAPAASKQQMNLTPEQLRDLADQRKQEEYNLAYRLQQARTSCPGCGDDVREFAW